MEGDGAERRGMIPRAVEQVFVSVGQLAEKGWQVSWHGKQTSLQTRAIHKLCEKESSLGCN